MKIILVFGTNLEALDSETVRLVGADYNKIMSKVSLLIDNPDHYFKMSNAVNPYSVGNAYNRIVNNIMAS